MSLPNPIHSKRKIGSMTQLQNKDEWWSNRSASVVVPRDRPTWPHHNHIIFFKLCLIYLWSHSTTKCVVVMRSRRRSRDTITGALSFDHHLIKTHYESLHGWTVQIIQMIINIHPNVTHTWRSMSRLGRPVQKTGRCFITFDLSRFRPIQMGPLSKPKRITPLSLPNKPCPTVSS